MQRAFSLQDAAAVRRLSSRDSQLGVKVASAMTIIGQAIERYGSSLALSFNGGKDCTVLAHLYAAAVALRPPSSPAAAAASSSASPPALQRNGHDSSRRLASIYVQCQSPFPQVEEFVDRCSERYNLDLSRISAPMKEALRRYKAERESLHAQKVEAVLVGTRIGDPYSEKLQSFTMTDPDWPPLMRVHPILDWTYADIWDFLRSPELGQDAIEWCSLYNYGYTSLGSTYNTIPNPELRDPSRPSGWKAAWELQDASAERAGRPAGPIPKEVVSPLQKAAARPAVENGHEAESAK